jgi:hypothetical protein
MTTAIVAEAVWKVPLLRLRSLRAPLDERLRSGGVASLRA